MLLDRGNGQAHLNRYGGERKVMHASQQEDLSRLRRQAVDQTLEPAQFVPRLDLPLHRRIVGAQDIEVGDEVQGHDGLAAQGVDQQVAGDRHEVGAASGDPCKILNLIGASQALGH